MSPKPQDNAKPEILQEMRFALWGGPGRNIPRVGGLFLRAGGGAQ